MKDAAIAEALLLAFFTPDELAELTTGELHLLAAAASEDLPEVPSMEEEQRTQREYAGRVFSAITVIAVDCSWGASAPRTDN